METILEEKYSEIYKNSEIYDKDRIYYEKTKIFNKMFFGEYNIIFNLKSQLKITTCSDCMVIYINKNALWK